MTGLYFYDTEVFDLIDGIKPSRPGRIGNHGREQRVRVDGASHYRELTGWWTDAGTFDSLEEAGRRLKGAIS